METNKKQTARNLVDVALGVLSAWGQPVSELSERSTEKLCDELQSAFDAALAQRVVSEAVPVTIAGLGRITNEDDGYLTLQFKDEDSAQRFMQDHTPSVDVDDMPPIRDDTPAAPVALSDAEILKVAANAGLKVRTGNGAITFARALLAAATQPTDAALDKASILNAIENGLNAAGEELSQAAWRAIDSHIDATNKFATDADKRDAEPDMLWDAADTEGTFANDAQNFAEQYADNCMSSGDVSEVVIECGKRLPNRKMRIEVTSDENDWLKWEWIDDAAIAASAKEAK